MLIISFVATAVLFSIIGYAVRWRLPLWRRRKRELSKKDGNEIYEQHEPMFLLDHLHFGTKFRLYLAVNTEAFLKRVKPDLDSEDSRFSRIALFREEINTYEDLGALLLAIRDKNQKGIPILKTLMHYDSYKAIVGKLTAQHDIPKFIKEFGLKELICEAYLPAKFKNTVDDIRKKIAEILIKTFGSNSSLERYEAFIRIKHGPVIFKRSKGYSFDNGTAASADLSGVLIKARRISQKLRHGIQKKQRDIPVIAFCMMNTLEEAEKAVKHIDISTRFQQLLIICLLQRDHSEHLKEKGITQDMLFALGSDMKMLLEQLPGAWTF